MVSVQEAKMMISGKLACSDPSQVALADALNHILAKELYSQIDVPPFDNAAMDGYAVAWDSATQECTLMQHIQAGSISNIPVKGAETARIFTGAPIPAGADTVIQQELAHTENKMVRFDTSKLKKGSNIRYRGSQCRKGDRIATPGQLVTPGMVALLASAGITHVEVFLPPAVAIIITGNELKEPGSMLLPGEIYNSNEATLKAYLTNIGVKHIQSFHATDDLELLKNKLRTAFEENNFIILTGGISVGDHDFVQQALLDEGVQTLFYKVKQRPGKPLYVGRLQNTWIFALPGNPASVISCLNQYIKPCILGMMGHQQVFEPASRLPLGHDWHKDIPLTTILKARKTNGGVLILPGQESFNLLPFAEANCFVVLDENTRALKQGDYVDVYDW